MPTQRAALLCALATACIFFSCDSKKNFTVKKELIAKTANVEKQAGEAINLAESSNEFIAEVSQRFLVPMGSSSVITGKKGLRITVIPSLLEKEDGSVVDGEIAVSLVELTNSNDLFKANAATTSYGNLLASGGSYFIGMECNGQKLKISKGKSLKIDFPLLKKDEMELFYGERNNMLDMNWRLAGVALHQPENIREAQPVESVRFTDNDPNGPMYDMAPSFYELKETTVYKSTDAEVYYYKKKMKLRELVDTLNLHGPKVFIDTIHNWPGNLPTDRKLDTNYLVWQYGPRNTFRLKSCKIAQQEKEEQEKRRVIREQAIEKWQPQSLAGQVQKYYAPAVIGRLGWINCDRFYQNNEQINVDLDIPITMHNSNVEYFIIFKSFNGLMNNRFYFTQQQKASLNSLPAGEKVILVAFIKKEGVIYKSREEFVVGKDKKIVLNFETISSAAMSNIFRSNVRI